MSEIKDGGPAFPVSTRVCDDGGTSYGHQDGTSTFQYGGMTLRDFFAAKALQGMLAAPLDNDEDDSTWDDRAHAAYLYADAMLRARSQS